jgi:phosphoglycolate phosphatase-like HAD superfamily hydrolase
MGRCHASLGTRIPALVESPDVWYQPVTHFLEIFLVALYSLTAADKCCGKRFTSRLLAVARAVSAAAAVSSVRSWEYNPHMLRAVMFDFGHTIMDELKGGEIPLASRPVCLMPGLPEILPHIAFRMGIWANTKVAREYDIRVWLTRARINDHFGWVITSVDAGARKPDRRFFSYALKKCKLKKEEVLFVDNQLNTDIRGANDYGIRCVWLSGHAYRSADDTPNEALVIHGRNRLFSMVW